MRVKITKDYRQHKQGDIVEVSPNEGFGLIDAGYAIVSKDMTRTDIKETQHGRTVKLRTNKFK